MKISTWLFLWVSFFSLFMIGVGSNRELLISLGLQGQWALVGYSYGRGWE